MRMLHRLNFRVCLALVSAAIIGCEKRTGAPESPAGEESHLGWLKIDGEVDDWPEETLLLDDVAWPVSPEDGIEVRGLHLLARDRAVGIFLVCKPSPGQWYEQRSSVTSIAELLLDVDNDPSTGRAPGGFEAKVEFHLGEGTQWTPQSGNQEFYQTSVDVSRWDPEKRRFRRGVLNLAWNSRDTPDLIADGPDGVELVLEPEVMGIEPGATVRVVLAPWASPDSYRSDHQWSLRFQGGSGAGSGP